MPPSILQNCDHIDGLSCVRQTAGGFENFAVSGYLEIIRPHQLTHCWKTRRVNQDAARHRLRR